MKIKERVKLNTDDKKIYEKLSLIDKVTLKIIQVGVNKTNFKILKMVPTDVDNIMKETGLSKVPVNVRLNELEKVGLITRFRGTGKISMTEFGKKFMKIIHDEENMIRGRLEETIENII